MKKDGELKNDSIVAVDKAEKEITTDYWQSMTQSVAVCFSKGVYEKAYNALATLNSTGITFQE